MRITLVRGNTLVINGEGLSRDSDIYTNTERL